MPPVSTNPCLPVRQEHAYRRYVVNAGRAGRESDIGSTVLLLASIGGSFYNHQILFPDGGRLSR
jgi:hypothetical protein